MFDFQYRPMLWRTVAIFLVAICVVNTRANAQNASESIDLNAQEQVERARIASERAALAKSLELQRQACYQKLGVTPCLNDVRDEFNEKMRDLKRQEVALNDMRRKRAAAQRLADLDERNSPQAQLERAQRRGRALEESAQRERERQQRQTERAAAPASASADAPRREPSAPTPSGKPRAASPPSDGDKTAADRAARTEASRAQAKAREKAAQDRRAKAKEREASRTKPPAAPLPIPN
jgi:hypothetical protein